MKDFSVFPINKKMFAAGRLLFLGGVLLLTACSNNPLIPLKAGTADYKNYPEGGSLSVSATFAEDGRLWRVVPEKQHIYVDYSTDLGKTFSAPVAVNTEAQKIKVSGENRPSIAVNPKGQIFLLYTAEGTQPATVYFSVSNDKGQSFSAPTPVSEKAEAAYSFQGRLALNHAGQVYAFWHDDRDRNNWQQPGNSIYYTVMSGEHTSKPISQKAVGTACECCRIAVAFEQEKLPVLFARFVYEGGIRDHGLIKNFTDSKQAQTKQVTFDHWQIEACPDHGPAIAISDDDRYHITWFTQGSHRQGLFYAYSTNKGESFSKPLAFGTAEKLPSHPDVMAQGKHIVLTWTEFDGSKTQLLVMQSMDGGQSWQAPKAIAEAAAEADFPFLLSSNQHLFVSWNSKKEGYRLIALD